ncbi:MAG: lytic transglycosylase domain-containing protein [Chloroflexi bacterium]|nr:lytic transglycosylase domain-containing protein [Chloroflexota bacterium]
MAPPKRKQYPPSDAPQKLPRRVTNRFLRRAWLGISAALLIACGVIGFISTLGAALLLHATASSITTYQVLDTNRPIYAESPVGSAAAISPLSAVFTAEVQYWGPLIMAWGAQYQIDPNLIATLIQIESCGDPTVSSPSGAQGLFQVMPFHFEDGEDMLEVQTNARRGMNYLSGGLDRSDGHAGLALAGYNGGHGVINRGWAAWADETRRYYYWGSRIYSEAVSGMAASPTLEEWLSAGGSVLCARANQSQQQLEAQKQQQAQSIALAAQ